MGVDPTATDWYYTQTSIQGAQPVGPLTWAQLWSLAQAGSLAPTDLVWHATLPQWLPAAQIPGLLPSTAPPPMVRQPMPPGPYGRPPRPAWMLPLVISLVVIVLAGVGLGVYFGVFWHRDEKVITGTVPATSERTTTTTLTSTSTSGTTPTTAPATTVTSDTATTTTTTASGTWVDLDPTGDVPSARMAPAVAFETATKNIYLFGGAAKVDSDYSFFGDTYYFDPVANTWSTFDPIMSPPARSDSAMAYDEDDGQLILFGGWVGGDNYLGDTWGYDPLTFHWFDLEPEGDLPSARDDAVLAYDPGSGASIMFGGTAYLDMFNDTWSFDRAENSWMDLDPSGPLPPARWGHSMVYCPDTRSMLLFGGMTEDGSTNDLWSYDPASNTWTEFEPAGPLPSPRSDQATAYDIAAGRLILFGGWDDNDQILGDTWAYDPGANAWTELEPSGAAPPPRAIAAMTYDRASGRVILFGGFDQQRQFNDVWAFSF